MRMGIFGAKKPRQKFSIALILLYFVVLLLLYIIQIKSVLSHKTRLITLQQLKIQVTSEIKRHILILSTKVAYIQIKLPARLLFKTQGLLKTHFYTVLLNKNVRLLF